MSRPTLTAPPVGALTDGEIAQMRAWAEDYAAAVLSAAQSPTADLGRLPERVIVDRHIPTGISTYGWTPEQFEAERRQCYALGVEQAAALAAKDGA